jgi:hypothetical protein
MAEWDAETRQEYDKLLAGLRRHEARLAGSLREIVKDFATRAYARPVTERELEKLMGLYRNERAAGVSFDYAAKAPLAAVLLSPPFVYQIQRSRDSDAPYRLSDYELARKLSMFLWASLPDDELVKLAGENRLHQRDVLLAQVDRLLADSRSRALGTQFGAHWLGFAYFDQHTAVDPDKFPKYDEKLREDMYEEAVLFFRDLFRNDLSAENLYQADYSFLNDRLARHYGLADLDGDALRKVKVPTDKRGGVAGMGAILTVTSTPLRTSPVIRGDWVTGKLLGSPVPEPPPGVEAISDDATDEEGLTIAEQLARHRAEPACASCHDILDPPGMSLESFDPIGRWRTEDSAGNPVEPVGRKSDGQVIEGFTGFRAYAAEHRDLICKTFCRKLLGYALGRSLRLTDEPLVRRMRTYLSENDYRVRGLLEIVVTSRQFQYRQDTPPQTPVPDEKEH